MVKDVPNEAKKVLLSKRPKSANTQFAFKWCGEGGKGKFDGETKVKVMEIQH